MYSFCSVEQSMRSRRTGKLKPLTSRLEAESTSLRSETTVSLGSSYRLFASFTLQFSLTASSADKTYFSPPSPLALAIFTAIFTASTTDCLLKTFVAPKPRLPPHITRIPTPRESTRTVGSVTPLLRE